MVDFAYSKVEIYKKILNMIFCRKNNDIQNNNFSN